MERLYGGDILSHGEIIFTKKHLKYFLLKYQHINKPFYLDLACMDNSYFSLHLFLINKQATQKRSYYLFNMFFAKCLHPNKTNS
jgi:hypothetical protein